MADIRTPQPGITPDLHSLRITLRITPIADSFLLLQLRVL